MTGIGHQSGGLDRRPVMSSYRVTAWLRKIPMAAPGWQVAGGGVIAGRRQREGRGGVTPCS